MQMFQKRAGCGEQIVQDGAEAAVLEFELCVYQCLLKNSRTWLLFLFSAEGLNRLSDSTAVVVFSVMWPNYFSSSPDFVVGSFTVGAEAATAELVSVNDFKWITQPHVVHPSKSHPAVLWEEGKEQLAVSLAHEGD